MAKLSLKLKQQAPAKFSTRKYNRCKICGRPHAYLRNYGICRICFRELAYKGQIPGVKKPAGKHSRRTGTESPRIGGIGRRLADTCRFDRRQRLYFEQGGTPSMQITDPIADMLTRIRNANSAKHDSVDIPASNMKKAIAEILLQEGYIKNYQIIDDGTQGIIRVALKYNAGKERVIQGLRRVSKPGLRVYAGASELPKVLKGLGIAIISTSRGVMTDKKARELHVGGEVLAFVW